MGSVYARSDAGDNLVDQEQRAAQQSDLAVDVLRSRLQDILASAGVVKKAANLSRRSIGEIFKGRGFL